MEFRTRVDIPVSDVPINHSTGIMLFGSCFSSYIGSQLQQYKFTVDVNPFGILFNPLSISNAIQRLLYGKGVGEADLVQRQGIYHSFMHHGEFSSPDRQACLDAISTRFTRASEALLKADLMLVTFGTAYLYRRKETGEVVSNCHKFPEGDFQRARLSVDEIVEEWGALIEGLTARRPTMKWVFTVSPVRHWKDGAHENQVSKSILHLAIDELQKRFEGVVRYFPAYEIVLDELRDYRFYNEDMIHPSPVAVEYVWQRFSDTFFNLRTRTINREWESIRRSLDHRPLFSDSESHQTFLEQTALKLREFEQKYPFISCEEEARMLHAKLNGNG
ncbi:MAG: GSCFA domain-containing protein [Bacteroidota bacterium]|jgi:hypothetical protein|nr:GSCFA domain-containing protein [Bacteroidota bacterium]HHU96887.1 GSCFA domain-containing protein [Petrimonas sp.]